jgi:peptidoglycan hydrolase-like protein with peptidoglycan-binding domain
MKRRLLPVLLILFLCCAAACAEGTGSLKYGDTGDEVLRLQTRLKELEYYNGPLSGTFAEVTQKAVKAVQEAYGLEETGIADEATQAIIYGECYRPLEYGMTGTGVTRLQEALASYGYYHDKISEKYLKNTRSAVESFQADNGLEATGKADVKTLELLYSGTIPTPTPSPTPTPTATPSPTPTPNITYTGKLQRGDTGERVKQVQERLKELGFYEGKITTGFYDRTKTAVKKFQQYNALEEDGVVGEQTWNALFSDTAVPASATPMPTAEPTLPPYFIEVDVTNQVTKIYTRDEQGEFTVLYKTFICSTGTKGYPSTIGTFTLTGRKALWCTFPKWGGGTAQYWTKINDDIAFHSVMYRNYDPQDLVESSYKNLGKRASHGCIRLTVPDAKWIYNNCGEGTQVWIHDDAASDPELTYSVKPGNINPDTKTNYVTPTPTVKPAYDSHNPPETVRQMNVGSHGDDVYWVQMRLTELGYYTGTVTGTYRDGTKAAVKAYQQDRNLGSDGIAGRKTLNYMYDEARNEPTATPIPTETPIPTATPTPSPTPTFTPTPTASPTPTPAVTAAATDTAAPPFSGAGKNSASDAK